MTVEGPRAAQVDELEAVVDLANRVFRPREQAMGEEFPLLFCPENLDNLRVFVDDGRPVSHVGMIERDLVLGGTRHRCAEIGAVCTDPDYRGQGLATRLVHDAREKAVRDGVDIFLISGARRLYRRQGYVGVGDYGTYTVTRKKLPERGPFTVRSWQPEDVPALVRLNAGEPVRFVRPPDDLRAFLGTGRVVNMRGDVKVVCRKDGTPVAYVAHWNPGEHDLGDQAVAIREIAGSRAAITAALPALFDEHDLNKVLLDYLGCDLELRALAARHGWPSEARAFHGTVGIIDPRAFWRACTPLFEELLGAETVARMHCFCSDEAVKLGLDDEQLTLPDMQSFTRLVFLRSEDRDELELDLSDGSELRGLLDTLFPLPLVSYGLNFI